jgi:hypothetical protein
VSNDGVLAYQRAAPGSQMVWFDRQGRRLGVATPPGDYNTLCLTSDETRIVYDQADPVSGSIDIWALEKGVASPSRLTFQPAIDFGPICGPSGPEVVFASLRAGPPSLYRLLITAPGSEKPMVVSPLPKIASDFEVYVQPFPPTGAKWQVSRGGGHQPQWWRDGRELFYIAPDKKLIGVAVQTGSAFVPGAATPLVDTRITAWERSNHGSQYAATADGERFLVNNATDTTLPITLVLNWMAALKK